jgi:hypothetical protein
MLLHGGGGGGDDMHSSRFPLRSPGRMDRGELVSSPAARQIYLTFPADSTFGEDDVSNYFRYWARRHYWGSCFCFDNCLSSPSLSLSW